MADAFDAQVRATGLTPLSEEREVVAARRAALAAGDLARAAAEEEAARRRTLIQRALAQWRAVEEAEREQRRQELEDLKFARGLREDQWPEEVLRLRQGGDVVAGVVLPARPCLVLNRLKQPLAQVINEARQARLSLVVRPKGDRATVEGAELRQGLLRAIEADSNAAEARLWALERAVKCGRGYYRILTVYAQDGDFDLDLRVAPIKHQGSVYLDPSAQEWDGSDARYAFITEDLTRAEYRQRFGVDPPGTSWWETETDVPPEWVSDEHVRIAEYWWVEEDAQEVVSDPRLAGLGPGGATTVPATALPPDWQDGLETRRRRVVTRRVRWALLSASDVLEEREWPGRYIPIVPVFGERHDVDGRRVVYKGLVTDAKDAQRSYNYMRSSQVEQVGLAPRVPFVMAGGQQEGYEAMWASANVRNYPYLLYNPMEFNGQLLPPPQRLPPGEMGIEAVTMAVREAETDIKATTGRFDPSLGQWSSERSGRAIRELKVQGETGSSHFVDYLANISMIHEARILLDLLPKVYDRPGRLARLLGESEDQATWVLLGQPFVPGPDGRPVPVPPGGVPPGSPPPRLYAWRDEETYTVAISVGRQQQTQRDANLQVITAMIEATKGQIAPLVVDIWAEMLDGPMARRLADRFRRLNPQLAAAAAAEQGLSAGATSPALVAQLQQQLQMAAQQVQQLQAALAEAQQAVQTQRVRAEAEWRKAQLEAASRERIAALEAEVELIKTRALLDQRAGAELLKAKEQALQAQTRTLGQVELARVTGEEARRTAAVQAALRAAQSVAAGPAGGEGMPWGAPWPAAASSDQATEE